VFDVDLTKLCSRMTRDELMCQICGLHPLEPGKVGAHKVLPPLPPKKKKKVTFVEQPTTVTYKTLDQLEDTHNIESEPRKGHNQTLMSAIRHVGYSQNLSQTHVQVTATQNEAIHLERKEIPTHSLENQDKNKETYGIHHLRRATQPVAGIPTHQAQAPNKDHVRATPVHNEANLGNAKATHPHSLATQENTKATCSI
jgi:hypothetical protein